LKNKILNDTGFLSRVEKIFQKTECYKVFVKYKNQKNYQKLLTLVFFIITVIIKILVPIKNYFFKEKLEV
jgi:hypothetical protein